MRQSWPVVPLLTGVVAATRQTLTQLEDERTRPVTLGPIRVR